MKRWNSEKDDYVEDEKIDNFIEDILKVCKKHRMSISHQDGHGAFEIENYNDRDARWLREANISISFKSIEPKPVPLYVQFLLEGKPTKRVTTSGMMELIPTQEMKDFITKWINDGSLTECKLWEKFGQRVIDDEVRAPTEEEAAEGLGALFGGDDE